MNARQREDAQMFRLLGFGSNPNGMLFGAVALALGTVAFGWAWKSGRLENSGPVQAMLEEENGANEYMMREGFFPKKDYDVIVKIDDKVVKIAEDGDGTVEVL